jgi:HSP20 family protein
MDVRDHGNELIVTAVIPGVQKEDVNVTLDKGVLTISGERKGPELPKDASWISNEIPSGTFSRSIELPARIASNGIQAELENGVLRVVLPKSEEERPRQISIK